MRKLWPRSVLDAAGHYGLDLSNEHHRDVLLSRLADVVFKKKKRGRRPFTGKWNLTRLESLGLAALKYRDMPDTRAARLIFAEAEKGTFQSAEVIRRMLPRQNGRAGR